jgi:hypothetical protein
MRSHVVVIAGFAGLGAAGVANAQAVGPTFCTAAGSYMHEIAARRGAGSAKDDAVREAAPDFDALATSEADLAMRRRVLGIGRPLATFVFDLGDLQPATVQQIGEAYCVARGGSIDLAPPTATSGRMGAAARECESKSADSSSGASACVARIVDEREVRLARESSPNERLGPKVQPFYEFALSYGGDAVGTILFVDGGSQDVDSGNGITAGGGVIHRITSSFGIKYTVGYKVSFSAASNADVTKSVVPIDIVPYYRRGDHRFGIGLSHHLSPKIDWDWLAPTMNFDDATGVTLEYAFKRFSFSYTDIDYELGPAAVDAGHFTFKYSSRH